MSSYWNTMINGLCKDLNTKRLYRAGSLRRRGRCRLPICKQNPGTDSQHRRCLLCRFYESSHSKALLSYMCSYRQTDKHTLPIAIYPNQVRYVLALALVTPIRLFEWKLPSLVSFKYTTFSSLVHECDAALRPADVYTSTLITKVWGLLR